MSRRSLSPARRQPPLLPLLLSLVLALGIVLGLPVRAAADGPTSFSNTASIAIPGIGDVPPRLGPALPYPSNVGVNGMTGTVTKVTVTFHNLTHTIANDIDAMVVAPDGRNLVVMSDATSVGTFTTATNATLTFDDDAPNALPLAGAIASGQYMPTNRSIGDPDAFPGAPTPSNATTLGVFTGMASANGTWALYVADDGDGDIGVMAGGWSLTVTTATAAVSTTTVLSSSDANSNTGQTVTFTATVRTGAGAPVPTGTVRFVDETTGTTLGSPSPNSAGVATVTAADLAEGSHLIRATFSGAGFLGSFASITQRVDNATVVTDTTFCNPGAITLPDSGTATPYPSNIFVSGLPGQISKMTASLTGVTHDASIDLDVLLSGPTPTQNLFLLSDAGGNDNAVTDADLTFDDDAVAGLVPSPIVSGTFRPTRVVDETADSMPAPAPTPSSATQLSTFNGGSANGTWSLWVRDDATGDNGSIAGGWCLTITSQSPTTTAVTVTPDPSTFGQTVTLRAVVTSGGNPVPEGTVQFRDGATDLATPVEVDGDGVATLTTSALAVGPHTVTAAYSGTAGLGESSGTVTQVVNRAASSTTLTSSLNPSDVGDSVIFTATVTTGGTLPTGTVQFAVDGTDVGGPVTLDGTGQATFTTGGLAAGTREITATYGGSTNYAPSGAERDQVVNRIATETALSSDNNPSEVGEPVTFTATVTAVGGEPVTGTVQFEDGGTDLGSPVTVEDDGTAELSTSVLAADTHAITATFVQTPRFAESASDPVDQVVGLVPTTTVLDPAPIPSDVDEPVTFTATVTVPTGGGSVSPGAVQFSVDGTDRGAPVAVDVDGVATLTIDDLSAGSHPVVARFVATSRFAGSTSDTVDQIVERIGTTIVLQSAPNPSDPNESVTFTATVTDPSSDPVTTGSATFTVDGIPITGGPVALDASGTASFDSAALDPGAHTVIVTYAENEIYGGAAARINHVVRPVAEPNGPYTVAEGSSLTLDTAGSTPGAIYAWDVNGDGDFTDATGSAPTLSWIQLDGLGVNDGPSTRTVTLRVTLDGGSAASAAELSVTNTAPASVLTGGLAATVGVPFMIKVGAEDPSSADMAALFTYTVDWGDGSPVLSVDGPADPPVTHTYTAPGDYAASFTATDKDGGRGAPTAVTVRAGDAPIVTPSPTPTTSEPDDYTDDDTDYDDTDYTDSDDADSDDADLASTGSSVGPGTIVLGLALLIGGGGALVVSRRRRLGGPRHRG